MSCAAELLADVELFASLDADDRQRLADMIQTRTLAAGTKLFQAGEPGEALYVVKTGQIELFIKDTAGQRIVLHVAEPGEVFGEMAMLDAGPRTASAVALMDTELLELDRDHLLLLFQKSPDSALQMLAAMGRKTRK